MPKFEGNYIAKAHRQHTSLVVVIPISVRRVLELKTGDYLIFSSHPGTHTVELTKFVPGGKKDGRGKNRSDSKNRRG